MEQRFHTENEAKAFAENYGGYYGYYAYTVKGGYYFATVGRPEHPQYHVIGNF